MKEYTVYYNIESKSRHRSLEDSNSSDNLNEVNELVELLESKNDCISIYSESRKTRVMIWAEADGYVLEIHLGERGGFFSKGFSESDLILFLSDEFEKVLDDPNNFGFNFESW